MLVSHMFLVKCLKHISCDFDTLICVWVLTGFQIWVRIVRHLIQFVLSESLCDVALGVKLVNSGQKQIWESSGMPIAWRTVELCFVGWCLSFTYYSLVLWFLNIKSFIYIVLPLWVKLIRDHSWLSEITHIMYVSVCVSIQKYIHICNLPVFFFSGANYDGNRWLSMVEWLHCSCML